MQAKIINLARYKPGMQLSLSLSLPCKAAIIRFPVNDAKTNTFKWSDDAISNIRERLLMSTLGSLTDGRAVSAKTEAMEWMLSNEIHPFSFRVCADDMGMSYIEIRDRVLCMIDTLERKMTTASDSVLLQLN